MSLAEATAQELVVERPSGLLKDAWERLRSNRAALAGLVLLLLFIVCALFAPLIAPYGPLESVGSLSKNPEGPSSEFIFGLDEQGRDLFSRIIYGTRLSLLIGLVSVAVGLAAGLILGSIAGYFGGRVDAVIMRLMDVLLAFPGFLLAVGLVSVLGQGLWQIMIAVGIVNIPIFARLLRGSILGIRESDYVLAARSLGTPGPRLLVRHILPNAIAPVIVQATLAMATAIIDVAGLSFVGLGPQDPSLPEWGKMLADNANRLSRFHLVFFPGLAIVLSVLGINLIGDGLREAIDPKLSRGGEAGVTLLSVRDLEVKFSTRKATIHAVNGVSFDLEPGETLGIVGESGSGKSVTSLAMLGILPRQGRVTAGTVEFQGADMVKMSDRDLRAIRGNDIAMVFQDPMTSLNPVLRIGRQITEALRRHLGMSSDEADQEAARLLDRVGIPDAEKRLRSFPHQFSGGMRQRVMIAMAIACRPKILIADEPTTALDVTIQAQILDLLRSLVETERMALILITHDLGVVAGVCQRTNVMYAGSFIETAPTPELFASPKHPYTVGLLRSVPRLDATGHHRLHPIAGAPRNMTTIPTGCAFAPRCEYATQESWDEVPILREIRPGHRVACWNPVADADLAAAGTGPVADA